MTPRAKAVLALDSTAAGVAGLVMFACGAWLAQRYGFSRGLVRLFGTVNLAYSLYAGLLAWRAFRVGGLPRRSIDVLVAANLAWGAVCGAMVYRTWPTAHAFGVAHLVGEGLFVVGLAVLELRLVRPETT